MNQRIFFECPIKFDEAVDVSGPAHRGLGQIFSWYGVQHGTQTVGEESLHFPPPLDVEALPLRQGWNGGDGTVSHNTSGPGVFFDDVVGGKRRHVAPSIVGVHGVSTHAHAPSGQATVAPHPFRNAVFASVGEDKQLAVWDTSLRERRAMGRLPEMAHAVAWSPDGTHLAVGFVGGYFGVYDAATMERLAWHRRSRKDIDVVKFSPDGRQVATGSHENTIDLFDVRNKKSPYHHRKKLTGHSSSIKKLDWSADSLILQSNCAAYEILYWDAIKGKCLRASRDSTESDTIWATWTCTLGFPVMGVWYEGWDRTDVNAVHRSNDGELVVLVDDFGSVNLLNAPCLIKHAPRRVYQGHCSHVEDVTFLKDDHRVVTAGGHDKAIIQYKVVSASSESGASMHLSASLSNNVGSLGGGGGGDAPSDTRVGESILLPPKGQIRPAWTRVRYAGK